MACYGSSFTLLFYFGFTINIVQQNKILEHADYKNVNNCEDEVIVGLNPKIWHQF
jgi:hypothetical protein